MKITEERVSELEGRSTEIINLNDRQNKKLKEMNTVSGTY